MHVSTRVLAMSAAALALSACAANPKKPVSSTEINDGAVASAPAPAEAAAPAPAPEVVPPPAPDCAIVRVQFAYDSSQLDDGAMTTLRENTRCLADRKAQAVLVEGHADERGTTAYNVALGSRRAETVKKYLAGLGVQAEIQTVSFGEELPLAPGETEAVWSQNRRAELRLAGEARSDGKVFVPERGVAGR
jgi:peptidoglycan-associated lipoprotein